MNVDVNINIVICEYCNCNLQQRAWWESASRIPIMHRFLSASVSAVLVHRWNWRIRAKTKNVTCTNKQRKEQRDRFQFNGIEGDWWCWHNRVRGDPHRPYQFSHERRLFGARWLHSLQVSSPSSQNPCTFLSF